MRIPLLVACLLLAAAPAAALTEADNTLFLNLGEDWYLDTAVVEEGGTGQVGIVSNPANDMPQTDNAPMTPALERVVELDPDGTILVVLNVQTNATLTVEGQGVPVLLGGSVTIDCRLELGTEVVADCPPQEEVLVPGEPKQVTWSLAPNITRLDPAVGNLNLWFEVRGAATGALPTAGGSDPSRVVLPVVGGGELPVVLGNATMPLTASFDQPTTEVHELAYDFAHDGATFDFQVRSQHGAVNVTVVDAADRTVFSRALGDEDGEPASDLLETTASRNNVTPGPWTVRVAYTNFTGEMRFSITEYRVEAPAPVAPAPTPAEENETAGPSLEGDAGKESPGPALPLLALGVLGVAVARRRR